MNHRTAGVTSRGVRTLLLVASGAMAACGPITSSSVLIDAAAEVAAARTAGAEDAAPYELASAEAFLAKAQQEQGEAEFELAVALARRSVACAQSAVARTEGKTPPAEPGAEPMPELGCRPTRTSSSAPDRRAISEPRVVEPADPPPAPAPAPAVSGPLRVRDAAPPASRPSEDIPPSEPAPLPSPEPAPPPSRRASPDTPALEPSPLLEADEADESSTPPIREQPPKGSRP